MGVIRWNEKFCRNIIQSIPLISPSPEPVGELKEKVVTSALQSLDAQLSTLLEGRNETDSVLWKDLIVPAKSYFLDSKNEDSGINKGGTCSWQKNSSDLYHTPMWNESPGLCCHMPNSISVPLYSYNFHAPQASDSSEIALYLPPPSFAWAMPPTICKRPKSQRSEEFQTSVQFHS